MSVRHLFKSDDWYVINVDQGKSDGRPPWQERKVILHGPDIEASIAWHVLGKHGFGWGFRLGRNGGESDLGLDLYAGRIGSWWMRLCTPWTKWARVSKERDPKGWYNARHTGIRFHPHEGCLVRAEFEAYDMASRRGHEWSITKTTILGKWRTEKTPGRTGETVVPLPEGSYPATWKEVTFTSRYVRFPGTLRDRIMGPRRHSSYMLDIPGGIPVEGKGESDYDCGMDGVFGTSGATVEDAVANAVRSVLRDRKRYGGPHNLERPTTVSEASS